jgi:hypothetical protein
VSQHTPPPVTATAFYFHDAWILSRVAELLGKSDDAAAFAAKAQTIRRAYNATFFDATKGTYATGSQCANALPLVFGIVEPAHSNAVLAALVRDVESRGYQMTAGDVGFRFLLLALAQGGHSEAIYKMINQDERPGYGFMLKRGATSLTEAWDANLTSSHNHFMLGQITEWFYKDLVGIDCDPAGPGFKQIIIKPSPVGDLTFAQASYNSARGKISVRWERSSRNFRLKAGIPANTTATVYLPAQPGEIKEGNRPLAASPGTKLLARDATRAVISIESGQYDFESEF